MANKGLCDLGSPKPQSFWNTNVARQWYVGGEGTNTTIARRIPTRAYKIKDVCTSTLFKNSTEKRKKRKVYPVRSSTQVRRPTTAPHPTPPLPLHPPAFFVAPPDPTNYPRPSPSPASHTPSYSPCTTAPPPRLPDYSDSDRATNSGWTSGSRPRRTSGTTGFGGCRDRARRWRRRWGGTCGRGI